MPGPNPNPIPTSPTASAVSRARALASGQITPSLSGGFYPLPNPQQTHPENTTVFVGGLPGSVGRDELEAVFKPFGEVTYVNVPPGKSCGFISFDNRPSAEWAIEQLQGFWLHGAQLRLAWGRLQAGEKARQQHQQQTQTQGDLSAAIREDLPFFSQMLELTADQRVKMGLYLEFAASGNLARLKDIMLSKESSEPSLPPPRQHPRPKSPCACAPLPASRHDPYQIHGDLCRHYDRLVSDPADYHSPSYDSPPGDHSPASSSTPPLSFTSLSAPTDTSPAYPTSPRLGSTRNMPHQTSSVSSDHAHTFRPWQSQPQQKTSHRHSENCITPMSLQQLERLTRDDGRQSKMGVKGQAGSVERLGWGMGSMGLNAGAGEWTPTGPASSVRSGSMSIGYGARW